MTVFERLQECIHICKTKLCLILDMDRPNLCISVFIICRLIYSIAVKQLELSSSCFTEFVKFQSSFSIL